MMDGLVQQAPVEVLRYAWVLSGRHPPKKSVQAPEPRAEFEAFMDKSGARLFSLSNLGGSVPMISRIFARLGLRRLSLACLVQSQAGQFDVMIASGEDIGVPMALASLFTVSKTPIHMMFHGHHLESRKLRMLAPLLRRMKFVHFHCLSEALRARTQEQLGIPAARCHATGHGVDTAYFAGMAAGDAAIIASAGAANRDYVTLATAAAGLPVEVKIAADSTWVPPIAETQPRQWPANVELRSYGSYERLRALYSQSRFVVVPLHPANHACGYAVIAEAMAAGRAVIATRTACPPDFLCQDKTGLFVEAHDVEGLRVLICDLLGNPEKAARLGRQARDFIVAFNSLEAFCSRLELTIRHSLAAN